MVNFTDEDLRSIVYNAKNIRNMSVIAHVDHGKSTLTDSLVSKAGIIASKLAGNSRYTDTREDEQARCITIKSTSISLYFSHDLEDQNNKQGYLINLIDCPGHIDFSSEVTAALRVTDGALVVVDAVTGVSVQTETVLRQALSERIVTLLHINKLDRAILELKFSPEEMYQSFHKTIGDVNMIISTYRDKAVGDIQVDPRKGTVSFGSGLQGWAFTIDRFAKVYSAKYGHEKKILMERLWGDWFFDTEKKTFSKKKKNESSVRSFCKFILEPICSLFTEILSGDIDSYGEKIKMLGVEIKNPEQFPTPKAILKEVMQQWLNAGDTLLEMCVQHLPSPVEAQKYRVQNLYEGPMDDEAAIAIRDCNPEAPLLMYVSKMVPTSDKGRFYAFGRIFSGTISAGQKVRIQNPGYNPESKTSSSCVEVNIQKVVLMIGRTVKSLLQIPCGNTVGIIGVDQHLVKTGTITTFKNCYNIVDMKYSVSPVVRIAVRADDPKELPKLVDGLKKLSKSDPLVVCEIEESGEHIVAGCGELHIEICLKDLREEYAKIKINTSNPIVSYRETVIKVSSQTCLSKSANKHNRLYVTAEPFEKDLADAVENGVITPKVDLKERARILIDQFNWDKTYAAKIWAFGPENTGPNFFVDITSGVQYLNEIKDHCCSGFQWVTKKGVLCEENLRGVRFNLHDVTLHADAIHRGEGQISPACRKVLYAACLTASPRLLEPLYQVNITCPSDVSGTVGTILSLRRGRVISEEHRTGVPLVDIKAHVPVSESFGLASALREGTSGQASPQCAFSEWSLLEDDPLIPSTKVANTVKTIRTRKNLKPEIPPLDNYLDKL